MVENEQILRYELSYQDVIRILQLADQSAFQELKIELGDFKIWLETEGAAPAQPLPAGRLPSPVAPQQVGDRAIVQPQGAEGVAVTSVTGGVFYRAPAPGEPPYTEVGREVRAGDTLGLVELMKLFTPVTAPVAGTVRAICVENEQVLGAGQVLMVIAPAAL